MKSRNGFSFIQVLFAILTATVVGGFALYMMQAQRVLNAKIDKKDLLLALLKEQVAELHVRPLTNFPPTGNCLARDYSPEGVLLGETTGTLASATCTQLTPADLGVRITVLVQPIDDAHFTFSPSEFLKLPKYGDPIRQFRIVGGSRFGQKREAQPNIGITIFKRG